MEKEEFDKRKPSILLLPVFIVEKVTANLKRIGIKKSDLFLYDCVSQFWIPLKNWIPQEMNKNQSISFEQVEFTRVYLDTVTYRKHYL
jgi:hypothetical protein